MLETEQEGTTNEDHRDYGLKPLQMRIMEIMDYVHALCEKHSIRYYAIGGTAIGAVRHQGFVPWDDDLDIIMPYPDYQQFLRVCESELDTERFYLQREFTDELPKPFSKVRLNNTTYIEQVNPPQGMHQGIFIDVMCLHAGADTTVGRMLQFLAAKVVAARGLAMVDYRTQSVAKKAFIKTVCWLPKRFVFGAVAGFVARWEGKDTKTVCHIYGRAGFKQSFFPKAYVGQGQLVPFEQSQIRVFDDVDGFLTTRFGDYMRLPPHAERLADQHATKVDIARSYTYYTGE